MSYAGNNFQRICTDDRCDSHCTCEIQNPVLKPFSGEKACPSEQQCGREGWAKVVTKAVNPILNTKCQVKKGNKSCKDFLMLCSLQHLSVFRL